MFQEHNNLQQFHKLQYLFHPHQVHDRVIEVAQQGIDNRIAQRIQVDKRYTPDILVPVLAVIRNALGHAVKFLGRGILFLQKVLAVEVVFHHVLRGADARRRADESHIK